MPEKQNLRPVFPLADSTVTRVTFVLLAASLAFKIYLVVSGQWDIGSGDSAQRIRTALQTSLYGQLFTRKFFTDIWPHVPNIMQGLMLDFFRMTPLADRIDYTKACLILPAVLFTVGAGFLYATVRRIAGPAAGLFAIVALLGNELMNTLSVSGYAATYAFFFIAVASYVLLTRSASYAWIVVAAVLMQVAALCRTDAVVLSAIYAALLLFQRPRLKGVYFGVVAAAFFIARPLVLVTLGEQPAVLGSTGALYEFETDRAKLFAAFVDSWASILHSWDGAVLAFGAIGIVLLAVTRSSRVFPIVFCAYSAIVFVVCVTGIVPVYRPRYFYIPIVCLYLAAGVLCARLLDGSRRIRQRNLRVASFGALVILFVLFVAMQAYRLPARRNEPQYTTMRLGVPEGVRDGLAWLNQRLDDGDSLHFDYLNNWDQYLHAKTDALNLDRRSLTYSGPPPLRYEGEVPDFGGDTALAVTFRAHAHIVGYEPKYYVGLSEREYGRIANATWMAKHKRSSYVRPYLEAIEPGAVYAFRSEFFEHDPIFLHKVHETSYLEIYEILYNPRDPASVIERGRFEKELREYEKTMHQLQGHFDRGVTVQQGPHHVEPGNGLNDLNDEFGFSLPRIERGRILHLGDSDLYVSGWYAAPERREIRVSLNGEAYPVRYGPRRDIETNFTAYPYRPGWTARVPRGALQSKNSLVIFVDDVQKMAVEVRLPD